MNNKDVRAKAREYNSRPEVKERRRVRDLKNRERLNAYARTWARNNPEKIRARRERNIATYLAWKAANPEVAYRSSKKYVSLNQEKRKAHLEVRYALKYGRLTRPEVCCDCSKPCFPDAHHEDYSKPLEVKWLCRRCHFDLHVRERREKWGLK